MWGAISSSNRLEMTSGQKVESLGHIVGGESAVTISKP